MTQKRLQWAEFKSLQIGNGKVHYILSEFELMNATREMNGVGTFSTPLLF